MHKLPKIWPQGRIDGVSAVSLPHVSERTSLQIVQLFSSWSGSSQEEMRLELGLGGGGGGEASIADGVADADGTVTGVSMLM